LLTFAIVVFCKDKLFIYYVNVLLKRYTSSVLRIKPNRIQKKLGRIAEILIEEKLKPTDFKDFSESVKRNY
jgi:hypothetical protein